MPLIIRPLEQRDNKALAAVIRTVLREFKVDQPGTVYTDPTTDALYELFQNPQSRYWVAEKNGILLGGCGIYPTEGLPNGCVEMVKFYVLEEARGEGIGKKLMDRSTRSALELGFKQMYLESLPELSKAVGMYERAGFKHLKAPLGNSGHFACTVLMLKDLELY